MNTDYSAVIADLTAAQTDWTSASAVLGPLTLSILVNDAKLQTDQSAADAQAAIAAGTASE